MTPSADHRSVSGRHHTRTDTRIERPGCSRTGGAGAWIKPQALFTRLLPPQGDEKIRLKGRFSAGSAQPIIIPSVHGVHVRVVDNHGGLVADERIPSIAGGGVWKVSSRKWIFSDKKPIATHNGIVKLVIKDLSSAATPNFFGLLVKGKNGHYPIVPGDEPLTVTIELNDNALPPGGTPGRDQCGEVVFLDPPQEPSCVFKNAKLKCK